MLAANANAPVNTGAFYYFSDLRRLVLYLHESATRRVVDSWSYGHKFKFVELC